MRSGLAVAISLLTASGVLADGAESRGPIRLALEPQRYYVHCVNNKVSSEQWDEEQMRVRHGSSVCQLRSFTSSSSAQSWARSNFPSGRCSC